MKYKVSYNSMYDACVYDYAVIQAPPGDCEAMANAIADNFIGDYIPIQRYLAMDEDEQEYYFPLFDRDVALI